MRITFAIKCNGNVQPPALAAKPFAMCHSRTASAKQRTSVIVVKPPGSTFHPVRDLPAQRRILH
jgi:hypothetical protein